MRVDTTKELRIDEVKPSWGFAIAVMDYLSPVGKDALRRGVHELINDYNRSSSPEAIQRLRELVEILAHLPI